ncbi:MbcA/ParS/Xre antitoxin family protein [Microvirga brassicacearum]|uniref:DUF2384 domain-containing protein n=1 Tax=Microvirga brassicacearum TaxID=2580413 RepID=A0A5N3PDR7_9HYPH|nr:MbcA/ParS/Xre antitoxin family protein [Microvirga brassicacearum]KAB0267854.1 DUF2384 domain-containing protein [Microvirga brassicacearum]
MSAAPAASIQSHDAAIVAKAVSRAAERLGLPGKVLGATIGLSEPSISRLKKGSYVLAPDSKSFELAILFLRAYRSLDAIVGGDATVAGRWLNSFNTALNARPVDAIQRITGLYQIIEYLDSRRAPL